MTTLHQAVEKHIHTNLERLDRAADRSPGVRPIGDRRASVDEFLVATAQHLSAIIQVVLPVVHRRLPESRSLAREYLAAAKRLERALVMTKAKQYGQSQNVGRPWSRVWASVREDLSAVTEMERLIVARLSDVLSDTEAHALGDRIAVATHHAPTRSHPHLPHQGVAGKVVRVVWGRADRVWDEVEGRVTRPLPTPEAG
ncbi:hypothetical protein [Microbacterium sp.]|uniref:hypothetical protein n=1 Tax=Microbacterium sp. TaxID=51671 RepID=UPI0027366557|nr:hypothetical protein [Microbacterium sp.]MDP3949578.1 hypothetical protein [Microbacterium sp.]